MTKTRVHFLTLDPGDMFQYKYDGPVFRRGPDTRDGRATVERALGRDWKAAGLQELYEGEGCFVIPFDDDDQEERP
jgi:hypothetical protein